MVPPAGTGIGMVVACLGAHAPGLNQRKSPAGTTPPPAQLTVPPLAPLVQLEVVVPPAVTLAHNVPRPALKLSLYTDVKYPSPKSVAVSPHVIKAGASTQTTH